MNMSIKKLLTEKEGYMNPIDKAISDTMYRIPMPILERAFLTERDMTGNVVNSPVSISYKIREKVIDPRVMVDCNLVGGTEVEIPLSGVLPEYLPNYKVIWRIPYHLTNNRKISRVYSLIHGEGGVPTATNLYNAGGSVYDDAANGLMQSHMPIPNISNAEVQLVGENTVMANMHIPQSPNLWLRVMLESDSEFSQLKPGSIPLFSKLVEYAIKSYIYNTLIIQIDQSMLYGGHTLGRFMNIVEDYADAEELYQETFDQRWRKAAIFSDDRAYKRHIKRLVGRQ